MQHAHDDSSASTLEKTDGHLSGHGAAANGHSTLNPITSQTDANDLPETAETPEGLAAEGDVEQAREKAPMNPMMDPSSFPDGGLKAWSVVLGGFCCLFVSFGWINCIGVFQDYYQTHQLRDYSPSTVAWIPALQTFMMFLGGPFIGKIYDNYGPRWILLFGSFMHVFGLMMTSLSTEYYQFILSQGICSPIGASCIFYTALGCTPTWFFRRRAFAFGIVASGSSLGGVIFPIMVQRLVNNVGFPWTMRASAFLILGLLVIANLTVRSRIPPVKKPVSVLEFLVPFTELPFSLVTAAGFLFFFGLFVPFTFIILQGISVGMSADLAGYLVPILNAASLFGRIIPGWIADKIGRFNVMIMTTYFSAIITLALWRNAHTSAAVIVFAALFGFSSGAYVSLAPATIAQISDVRQIGVRTGSLFAAISLAALFGSPVAGALNTRENGGFNELQIFAGVMMMGGATLFVLARVRLAGVKVMVKV
ncbi:MAG: hypothetical protein M1838_003939 [Thelocarpon superellum]|nr:MAG: hypothetical protein M1838_003939 [Thelocarpon superellum]